MKISKSIKIEAHFLFQLPEAYISISLVIPVRTLFGNWAWTVTLKNEIYLNSQLRCPASTFWKLETLKEMGSTGPSLKKKEVLQKYFVTWQLTEVSTVNNSFLQFWLCVDEQGCRGKPCSLVFEPGGGKKYWKIIKTFKECYRQTKTSVLREEFRVWPTFQVKVPEGWSRTSRIFYRIF